MRGRSLVLAASCAAFAPSGLSATAIAPVEAAGLSGDDRSARARREEAEAQRRMNSYARCVLRRSRRDVARFLAAPMGSPEAREIGARIATASCLGDGQALRFQAHLFRGSLFEALYLADFRDAPAILATDVPLTSVDIIPLAPGAREQEWLAMRAFADCVVRANIAGARNLILSEVTTAEEDSAFRAIVPALGPCLDAGTRLSFSRPVMRGLIAESLYRLTVAATMPAAAGVAR